MAHIQALARRDGWWLDVEREQARTSVGPFEQRTSSSGLSTAPRRDGFAAGTSAPAASRAVLSGQAMAARLIAENHAATM